MTLKPTYDVVIDLVETKNQILILFNKQAEYSSALIEEFKSMEELHGFSVYEISNPRVPTYRIIYDVTYTPRSILCEIVSLLREYGLNKLGQVVNGLVHPIYNNPYDDSEQAQPEV